MNEILIIVKVDGWFFFKVDTMNLEYFFLRGNEAENILQHCL